MVSYICNARMIYSGSFNTSMLVLAQALPAVRKGFQAQPHTQTRAHTYAFSALAIIRDRNYGGFAFFMADLVIEHMKGYVSMGRECVHHRPYSVNQTLNGCTRDPANNIE